MENNFRKLREEKKLKQKEIADYLNMSDNAYGSYERGISEPSIENIKKLADFYGVSTDYLLGYRKELDWKRNQDILSNKTPMQQQVVKMVLLLKDEDLFETSGFIKGLITAHGTRSDSEDMTL